jgi:hypothetical protein
MRQLRRPPVGRPADARVAMRARDEGRLILGAAERMAAGHRPARVGAARASESERDQECGGYEASAHPFPLAR